MDLFASFQMNKVKISINVGENTIQRNTKQLKIPQSRQDQKNKKELEKAINKQGNEN